MGDAVSQHRRASDRVPTRASKRALFAVSRGIEGYAAALLDSGQDVLLVGLFQDATYYGHSSGLYESLAGAGADVVVGYAGPRLDARGVRTMLLPEGHVLVDEWTVLLACRRACAALVADDLFESGSGRSAEDARMFASAVSTEPATLRTHLHRVLASGRDLLDEPVATRLARWADLAGAEGDPVDSAAGAHLQQAWERVTDTIDRLQEVERVAMTDPLTGAMNRRFLERYLHRLGPRSPALTAVAFDFDDFKHLNDTYGHAVGDEALRTFVEVVRAHVRDTDVLVRLGGDEWLLLLPGIGLQTAVDRVERIIAAAAQRELSAAGARIRSSAGVGRFPASGLDLERVDEALYRAKESGQRVEVVTET